MGRVSIPSIGLSPPYVGACLSKVEVITLKMLWSPTWLGWPLWNFCVTNDHGYVPRPVLSWFSTYHRACNSIDTTGATSGAGIAYPSGAPELIPGFWWCSCYSIFSFKCMFYRSFFVLLYFLFWPLCYLFFFDIRVLITPLVSSNSSLTWISNVRCRSHVLSSMIWGDCSPCSCWWNFSLWLFKLSFNYSFRIVWKYCFKVVGIPLTKIERVPLKIRFMDIKCYPWLIWIMLQRQL